MQMELGEAVKRACQEGKAGEFKFLYDLNLSIKEKIETIATVTYGAAGVSYTPQVRGWGWTQKSSA